MILTFGQFFLLCLTAPGPKREQKVHKKNIYSSRKAELGSPLGVSFLACGTVQKRKDSPKRRNI